MRINAISKGLIASLAIAGASVVSSCTDPNREVARNRAVKYLTGEEYCKADMLDKLVSSNYTSDADISNYWDTLLISYKSKEAYEKGAQMVRDSLKGDLYESFHKPKYTNNVSMSTDDTEAKNLYFEACEAKEEVSKYCTGEEFQELLKKEPFENSPVTRLGAHHTHFWNKLALQGAQRDAYNRGANDERAKIAKEEAKTEIEAYSIK